MKISIFRSVKNKNRTHLNLILLLLFFELSEFRRFLSQFPFDLVYLFDNDTSLLAPLCALACLSPVITA